MCIYIYVNMWFYRKYTAVIHDQLMNGGLFWFSIGILGLVSIAADRYTSMHAPSDPAISRS